jgi:Putative DNA-binding domain
MSLPLATMQHCAMHPEWLTTSSDFGRGLLDPHLQTPAFLRGLADRRYDVYRNNVTVGLVAALGANFPAVRRLLGPAYFDGFARDHARRQPPQSRLMFEYGEAFPDALAAVADLAAFPYLADVARLELAWLKSYHAADAACLTAQQLAAIDHGVLADLVLKPHPAAQMFSCRHAAATIMLANRSEDEVPTMVFTRQQFDVSVTLFPPAIFMFFEMLFAGKSLGEAADATGAAHGTFDISESLQLVLSTGAFLNLEE